MPLLRRGITGIGTLSVVDFRAFKKAVHAAAHGSGATVITATAAEGVTPNFHQADILHGDRELSVICNRNFPIVAFVKRPIKMSGVEPIHFSELADAIGNYGFEVAHAAELERPLEKGDIDVLSKDEQHEARYWNPERVGDLVFNWWD